ncbi:MAG: TRAP transporter small permease [Rectinema sp.]|nr:TRAP transporter small permease [Rectinema sp.]
MRKLYHALCKAEVFLAAACFSVSCCIIFSAAIARALKHPLNWSQDMSLFLFAWSVFLSADAALRADKLVNIDLLASRWSFNTRKYVRIFLNLIILVFLVLLFTNGIKLSLFSRRRVFQGIPGFSYSWVMLSIPVGSLLQIVTIIGKLKSALLSKASHSEISDPNNPPPQSAAQEN